MTDQRSTLSRLLPFSLSAGIFALTLVLLIQGRDLLIPMALALVVWYLINALASGIRRVIPDSLEPPEWVSVALAMAVMILVFALLGRLIGGSLAGVSLAAAGYQDNLDQLIQRIAGVLGIEDTPTMGEVFDEIDLRAMIGRFAESAAAVAGRIGIIVIYVVFLFLEQKSFDAKLSAMFADKERENTARRILSQIQDDVQTYLWVKTSMSVLTGGLSYVVLRLVGVDFPEFWAFVIFLLNYIPNIGSLLGVAFPALLALIQFDTITPFLVVAVALGAIQFAIGNLLEPRIMGRSLNISPLVVILSLAIWGTIWGIVGMFLSVPIMVIVMIVCAHFQSTRPIAVALSGDGRIDDYVTKD